MKNATVTASARKSQGEYKPVIVHTSGRTEVLQQATVKPYSRTLDGKRRLYTAEARGTTYATREEALAVAQAHIDRCLADALKRRAAAKARREEAVARGINMDHLPLTPYDREVAVWGGEG